MSLEQLATRIKAEHRHAVQTVRKSLEHARNAGELLAQAKDAIKDSPFRWGKWVEQGCGVQERTASNYLLLYRRWAEVEQAGDVSSRIRLRSSRNTTPRTQWRPCPCSPAPSGPTRPPYRRSWSGNGGSSSPRTRPPHARMNTDAYFLQNKIACLDCYLGKSLPRPDWDGSRPGVERSLAELDQFDHHHRGE